MTRTTGTEEWKRITVAAVMGAILGLVFGGITAFGATHGDATIRSGLDPGRIFGVSFAGWELSSIIIARLWTYARRERSANWVGIVSVSPLVLSSLVIASPRSAALSSLEVISFVIADLIIGIVVGELGWKHFGPLSGRNQNDIHDMRQ